MKGRDIAVEGWLRSKEEIVGSNLKSGLARLGINDHLTVANV
jgi:hypothetical protein